MDWYGGGAGGRLPLPRTKTRTPDSRFLASWCPDMLPAYQARSVAPVMKPAETSVRPRKIVQVLEIESSRKPELTRLTTQHSRTATNSFPYRLIVAPDADDGWVCISGCRSGCPSSKEECNACAIRLRSDVKWFYNSSLMIYWVRQAGTAARIVTSLRRVKR